ncbi:hypothetical protein NYR30_12980 [Gallibacterium salpingitidis]|uniref:hypothetical protein n=1 Tax=Gallibacterium salpingitidis TaxID=505341 RepID=UPI00266FFB90|nr:hypothetical protein [Gallibacterium salpingitidis]WKS99600.1 hypothetical protein NYR30_12980 [Gallibacterium salpingitidis]
MNLKFKRFLEEYSGYNGGDIGSPERPSIWCCGIEWGGEDITVESFMDYFESNEWQQISGFESEGDNIAVPYDKVLCKLLCAINGGNVEDYAEFALDNKVWMKGEKTGYLKLNLYPLWFKNTESERWNKGLNDILGFCDKQEYLRWCRLHRFSKINAMVQQHQPKLILCFGTTYEDDFNLAFSDGWCAFHDKKIDDLPVKWKRNENTNTVIVILPFPNVPKYGLQRNQSMQLIGDFIRTLI